MEDQGDRDIPGNSPNKKMKDRRKSQRGFFQSEVMIKAGTADQWRKDHINRQEEIFKARDHELPSA